MHQIKMTEERRHPLSAASHPTPQVRHVGIDLAIVCGVTMATYAVTAGFDLCDRFLSWVGPVEDWGLHDIIPALCVLSLACIWFGYRRWCALVQYTTEVQWINTALTREVAQRQKAEESLRASEEQFAKAFHACPLPMAILRVADGCVLDVNESFLRATGYEHDADIGWTTLELERWITPADRARLVHALDQHGMVRDFTIRLCTKAGEIRQELVSATVLDPSGERCVLAVTQDITERKRLEVQLRQAQKMETIGTLAGGIAHDFNNILSAMIGYTELAVAGLPVDSRSQHYLQEVLRAEHRARALVQHLLRFGRQTEPTRHPLQLHHVVNEALRLLRAWLPSTIELRQEIATEGDTVLADATQIYQVVMNLCTNAEYAMRGMGGVLTVGMTPVEIDATMTSRYAALHPGPYVRLTVRDTGTGMAPEVLEHIFAPFFTTKGLEESTGMGLTVVQGIVAEHSGAITVESTPDLGTTFAIYLPRIAEVVAAEVQPADETLPRGQGRILFVDDEDMLAALGKEILELLGYDVVSTTSSHDALEIFRATPAQFDLVLTDQTMPHMTGETLARELRHLRPDIPIILCTGFSHVIDARKAQELGLDAFVMKPLTTQALGATIQRVLAQRHAERHTSHDA